MSSYKSKMGQKERERVQADTVDIDNQMNPRPHSRNEGEIYKLGVASTYKVVQVMNVDKDREQSTQS